MLVYGNDVHLEYNPYDLYLDRIRSDEFSSRKCWLCLPDRSHAKESINCSDYLVECLGISHIRCSYDLLLEDKSTLAILSNYWLGMEFTERDTIIFHA